MPEINEWSSKQEDEVYRLIGKFIVMFSNFQGITELGLVLMLAPTSNERDKNRAMSIVYGNTAQSVFNWFFAAIQEDIDWSPSDKLLVGKVRKKCDKIIQIRNRISHDAWSLGHPNTPIGEGTDALRYSYRLSAKSGLLKEQTPVTVEELKKTIQEVEELTTLIRTLMITIRSPEKKPSNLLKLESNDRLTVR